MRTNKVWASAAVAALSAMTLTGCGSSDGAVGAEGLEGEPLVIGVIADTSGSASAYSKEGVEFIEMAAEAINRGEYPEGIADLFEDGSRGIDGRPVEIIIEDDGSDPNRAVQTARKLVSRGAKAIITTSSSASTMQARVACEEEKVPCVASTNASPAIVEPPNNAYVFTPAPTSSMIAEYYAANFEAKKYETVAFILDSSPTSAAVADQYKAAFEAVGMEVVANETIPIGSTDATTQVSRIAASQPDVVFDSTASAAEEGLFYKAAADRLADVPKWATNSLPGSTEVWEIAGSALDGVKAADIKSPESKYLNEVVDLYVEEHGGDGEVAWTSMAHWDAMMSLKKAFEDAGSDDGTAVTQAMEAIVDFPAAHGQPGYTISYSPENHNGATPMGLVPVTFEDGRLLVAEDETPPE